MSQLRGLAGRLNLPEVVTERAALMYRRALNKGLVKADDKRDGRSLDLRSV